MEGSDQIGPSEGRNRLIGGVFSAFEASKDKLRPRTAALPKREDRCSRHGKRRMSLEGPDVYRPGSENRNSEKLVGSLFGFRNK